MTGIADDIWAYILALFYDGKGIQAHIPTAGVNSDVRLLRGCNRIYTSINITNSGSTGTLNIGYGNPTYPIGAGVTLTLRFKNPDKCNLVYNDGGTATVIDIIG